MYDAYENGYYGEDLRPQPRMKNHISEEIEFVPSTLSPEIAKKFAAAKENLEYLKRTTLNEKPELFHNLQRIDVRIIHDIPDGWSLFDDPTAEEVLDLMRSIDSIGLIHPIHVMLTDAGKYVMLIGKFRHIAYMNLFEITGNDSRYKYIPAYVIKEDEFDELFLRNMIFESNFKFRSISKFNLIQTLISNYEIMRRSVTLIAA
jgi:hypothetical protein